MALTILILPPGERGEFEISREAWLENEYSPEWIGESVRERAMQLNTTLAMQILTRDYNGPDETFIVKWYPVDERAYGD